MNCVLYLLVNSMVVQHIKVSRSNKKEVEKLLASRERDITPYFILGIVLLVALVGFILKIIL